MSRVGDGQFKEVVGYLKNRTQKTEVLISKEMPGNDTQKPFEQAKKMDREVIEGITRF